MTMRGKDEHLKRLRRLSGPEVVKAAGRVLFVGADMIKADAQRSITAGSISGKGHIASKPGEAPNNDTATLKNGIHTAMTGPLEATVTSTAAHSAPLEFGTSKMGARPYMRPARDKMEDKIQRLFAKEIGNLIERSG